MSRSRGSASVMPITGSTFAIVTEEAVTPQKDPSNFRTVMRKRFRSYSVQVAIVCLVIFDALLVLTELMLDLKIIQPDKENFVAKVFYYLSTTILTFFLVEIALKLYVFHKEFLSHKFEILDVVVVFVSLALDITIMFQVHNFKVLRLVILFRLWRVARIMNGMIISVKTHSDREISKLKLINHQLAMKIQLLETSYTEKEQEIERLNKRLRELGVLE
ncbi:voltage-gated hydrogen channel 1-like isoform X1 [Macrotis lagotis]|uniref:voltage-gated hydrogen channel 1-like isoform X1 n=1 Tax=Macrotis lagotis TaxID=92651 RepID=UPI003D699B6D